MGYVTEDTPLATHMTIGKFCSRSEATEVASLSRLSCTLEGQLSAYCVAKL